MEHHLFIDALYVYGLIGRLETKVRNGQGSTEYTKAQKILNGSHPWDYLREVLLETSAEPEGASRVWEQLRELRSKLDQMVGGRGKVQKNNPFRVLHGDRGADLLLKPRVVRRLAQITGHSQETVINQVFDQEYLYGIVEE